MAILRPLTPRIGTLVVPQLKCYHNGFFDIYSKEYKSKCPLDNNEVEDAVAVAVAAAAVVAEAEVVVGIADPSVVVVVTVVAVDAEGTYLYFFV